jgi:DNA-binding transcriptional LysR family regulator
MNVTQPGVSRTIAHLELRLGFALFQRRGRRLAPTAEAQTLFHAVEMSYVGLDRIAQAAEDIRFQRTGTLRLATLPALAHGLVPRAIARFVQTRPRVSIFVQGLASREIAERVATHQFDAGVVELPLARPGIRTHALDPVAAVAVVPVGHRLADLHSVSVKHLAREPMVLLSPHSALRSLIDEAFLAAGTAPQAAIETPTSSIACALVAAGAGVTIVSRWAAEAFVDSGLVTVPLAGDLASRYALVVPDQGAPNPLTREFLAVFQELARQAGPARNHLAGG